MKKILFILISFIPVVLSAQDVIINMDHVDADLLNGQQSTYYLDTSSTAQTKSGQLTLSDSLILSNLATSETTVLSPTSTGGTKSLETALGTAITWSSLDVDNITVNEYVIKSVTADITAVNPGGQGDGALTTDINEVSTVGAGSDAITLPIAVAGLEIFIINNGANTLEIWPASGDDLGAGVNTATTLAAGANITFVSYDVTNWETK